LPAQNDPTSGDIPLPKRRVLLVDDEVTVLLTMKAVLEISGFDVDTAASAREGKSRIKLREYQMVITDMRMESDAAGREVIQAARSAPYHPAVALLTAFPEDDWADMGADKMLVKPMQTALLIKQIEKLLETCNASPQPLLRLTLPRKRPLKSQPQKKRRPRRAPSKKPRSPAKRSSPKSASGKNE
jgi:DNA-binding response OmpR family regulator